MIKIHQKILNTTVLAALTLWAAPSFAQANLTLTLPGGSTKVDSFTWGVKQTISVEPSRIYAGKVVFDDLTWTQKYGPNVPTLLSNQFTGRAFAGTFTSNDSETGSTLSLSAQNFLLGSISTSGTGVTGSVKFDDITLSYKPNSGVKALIPVVTTQLNLGAGTFTGLDKRLQPSFKDPKTDAALNGETSIYLRLGGASGDVITGDSSATGYENWIKLNTAQFSFTTPSSIQGAAGLVTGKTVASGIEWTQDLDGSIPAAVTRLAKGKSFSGATLEFVTSGVAGPVTFMQMAMTDVFLKSFAISSDSTGTEIRESLVFGAFSQTAWDIKDDGTRGQSTSFAWNILGNKAVSASLAKNVGGFGNGNLSPSAVALAVNLPPITPVPEPESYAMLLVGLGLIGGVVTRRKANCI